MTRPALARTAALAGALCVLAAALLFLPRWSQGTGGPVLRVVLLDASHSAAARFAPGRWAEQLSRELVREAKEARVAGEDLCIVCFGRGAARIFGPAPAPSDARDLPVLSAREFDEQASALDAGLELALALAQDGRALHVVVHGDGTSTGADPRPLFGALHERGARIEWREPPPREAGELCLEALDVPRTAAAGAPCAARVQLAWLSASTPPPASGLALEVSIENAERNQTHTRPIELPRGLAPRADGALAFDVRFELGPLAAGLNRVRVENLAASVHASGALTVGCVGADEYVARERTRAQARERGLVLLAIAPNELAARMAGLDVLLTGDLALERLPGELVASFVEQGGGWLACLGSANLPRWGPVTPVPALERCLPLAPRAHAAPPRERIVLLDVSGSMVGAPYAGVRAALGQMLEDTSVDEHFELWLFARELSGPIALTGMRGATHTEAARAFEERVPREVAGGSTALFAALEALAGEHAGRPALVVLLSDARDTSGADPKLELPRAKQALASAEIELVGIMPAGVGDRELLAELCGTERLFEAGWLADPAGRERLARLFVETMHPELVRASPHIDAISASSSRSSALALSILAAEDGADYFGPPRTPGSYVRSELRPGAEALWRSDTGDPLAGLATVGRGHGAALAFPPERAPFDLAPLLRAIARRADLRAPTLVRDEDELVLENAPSDLSPALELRIVQRDPDGTRRELGRTTLGPPRLGADPTRTRRGTLAWSELAADGGLAEVELTPTLSLPLALPPAPEFVFPRPSLTRLERDALAGQAALHGERRGAHRAAEPLLALGAFLVALGALGGAFTRRAG